MAKTCPYCSTTLTLPPTTATLIEKHPNIIPSILDRRIRRCRQCDLSTANKRAIEAECPPPNFTNPVLGVEQHINEVRGLIERDTRRTDLLRILPEMHRRRAALIEERDRRVVAAWREYSGIWGPQDVPAGVLFQG